MRLNVGFQGFLLLIHQATVFDVAFQQPSPLKEPGNTLTQGMR